MTISDSPRAALVAECDAARLAWRDAYMHRSDAKASDAYAVYLAACRALHDHDHPTHQEETPDAP